MCAIGQYTSSSHSDEKTTIAVNFILSAYAPQIRPGVMMANINWYTMKVWKGIVAA